MKKENAKYNRMMAAILHQEPDRVPKGELAISAALRDKLLENTPDAQASALKKEIAVRELLGMDFINIHEFPKQLLGYDSDGYPIYRSALGDTFKDNGTSTIMLKPALEDISEEPSYCTPDISHCTTTQIDFYRENSDLFLFAQINGPVSALDWMLGMEDYCCYCMEDPDGVESLAKKVMAFETARAKIFIDHGADAILIADDIAFNSGLLLPPNVMQQVAYPIYKAVIAELKAYKDVPVFLHTDGNINAALPDIIACGFDGLQSLQPSAGMDLVEVKQKYGRQLCLMGNLDLDRLLPFGTPGEVAQETKKLVEAANRNGGFILSTCNILTDMVPPANALAMYRAAEL